MSSPGHASIAIGQLRRHKLLGSTATYRVVGVDGELVEVEVVDAPGIPAGRRVRLLIDDVAGMALLEAPQADNALAPVVELSHRRPKHA